MTSRGRRSDAVKSLGRAVAACSSWGSCLGLVFALAGCDAAVDFAFERAAHERLANAPSWFAEGDDLQVVLCGTGAPLFVPGRAGPCTAVLAGGAMYIIDIGPAATGNLQRFRLPLDALRGVFLTHFHSDHIGGLGELGMQSWVAGRTEPLRVYGPTGAQQVVDGFRTAYAQDAQYRVAHHTSRLMPPAGGQLRAVEFAMRSERPSVQILETDGLRVTAFPVDHRPVAPAVGYRFDYRGRSVVVSGDTVTSPALMAAAHGTDLLIHEALAADFVKQGASAAQAAGRNRIADLAADVLDYHTTPAEALDVARASGAQRLVLTHLVPPVPSWLADRVFLRGLTGTDAIDVRVGEDGMHFVLPASPSKACEISTLD